MSMRWLLAALLCCSGGLALAQTVNGSLSGKVTSTSGEPLPGVTISLESSVLQGGRSATTDADGAYRIILLPPGTYTASFVMGGFATNKRDNVVIRLGRDTRLDIGLSPQQVEEQLTVELAVPKVDTTTASVGYSLDQDLIESLPTGRNYTSAVQIMPGITSDANPENTGQSTISVYGSSGAENSYFIDGVNTTGVEYGFQGKELNFEFIQEIELKTGGYEAEFGKSTGGIISVITKSGGNAFTGDVFAYLDSDGLQANAKDVVSAAGTNDGFTRKDFGVGFGGYFVKDKLWFFAAYDRVTHENDNVLPAGPEAGQIATSESTRDLASFKLTYNLAEGHSLVASYFQDPREDTGAINDSNHTLNGERLTYLGKQEFGGKDYALRYDGVMGSDWQLTAQMARHNEENSVGPATSAGDVVQYRDVENNFFQSGGFGLIQQKEFTRDFFGASVIRYFSSHEVKIGVEFEKQKAEVMKRFSGGQQIDFLRHPDAPGGMIYRHFYWTTPDAVVGNAPVSELNAPSQHKNTTLYLQDRWTIGLNFTLNYGIRWDRQQIIDRFDIKQIDLKEDIAPRIGFIWLPKGDETQKFYGSYGQYYEHIPMDLVIRSFSLERQPRITNFDPTGVTPNADAEELSGNESNILGGYTTPSDPDLRNQYINEFIIGYDREIAEDWTLGLKGIYREYGRVIEDFLGSDDGTYFIGNPGSGLMQQVYTLDYSQTFDAPEAVRDYKGLEVNLTKHFSDKWQGLASYIFSKLDGNFDGTYAPFTNVGADPNISAAYDYYDFFTDGQDLSTITNDGPLSNDRRHQLKFSGTYQAPRDISIGLTAYYRTGTPVTRYGYSDAYGRYEFFLTERGGEGRTPDNYEADLHVGYPLKLGKYRLNLLLDIFNLLNAQQPVLLDQRWGFQESDNQLATPANPNYKQAVLRTPPTTLRIGARLSF